MEKDNTVFIWFSNRDKILCFLYDQLFHMSSSDALDFLDRFLAMNPDSRYVTVLYQWNAFSHTFGYVLQNNHWFTYQNLLFMAYFSLIFPLNLATTTLCTVRKIVYPFIFATFYIKLCNYSYISKIPLLLI